MKDQGASRRDDEVFDDDDLAFDFQYDVDIQLLARAMIARSTPYLYGESVDIDPGIPVAGVSPPELFKAA